MVALHKDNEIYHIPNDLNKQSTLLNKFYHEKFIDLFKSNGIDYKLINYESYDGEFYIGRFAHALQDKELHSKCFDELYKHYGEKMWPNKSAYYYYDDKVRQYDLLKKFNIETPSIICNNFDELLQNISVGKVFKSTYGAGSESVSYIWENKQIDKLEDYINRSYNNEDFFPCMVQDYIDVEYEYSIFISDNQLFGAKQKPNKKYSEPLAFPHPENNNDKHWLSRNKKLEIKDIDPDDLSNDFIQKLITIQKELNTPNIKFDIMDNKVLEFSYMYGGVFPITYKTTHNYYDLKEKECKEKPISFYEWAYKQETSVLKHLGII